MKKIISIVSALAIVMSVVVSFATVASATTAPSVRIAATEITDWTVEPYKSKKTGFDWSSKGSQYKSYDVAVMFSGLELSSVWSDDANDYNGDYVGTAMNTVTANLSFSTTGERNTDWKYALLSGINSSAASKNAKADMYGYGFISPSAVYPKDEEMTITSSDEFAFYNLIVTVDTTKPLTISFGTVNIQIGNFDDSYDSESEMYNSFGVKAANYTEYKSSNGGVSTGEAVVLGGSSAPADIVPAAADSKVVGSETTDLHDADGNDVTIDSGYSYGAAKFEDVQIDAGDYIYKVVAKDSNGNEQEFDIADEYLEVSGEASFIAIVRSATRTIVSVVLKAFAK